MLGLCPGCCLSVAAERTLPLGKALKAPEAGSVIRMCAWCSKIPSGRDGCEETGRDLHGQGAARGRNPFCSEKERCEVTFVKGLPQKYFAAFAVLYKCEPLSLLRNPANLEL